MKNIYLSLISGLLFTACSLDRTPHDALSTVTFPKTEADVEMLAVGCYDGYANQDYTVYNDVFSDNGYCAIILTGLFLPMVQQLMLFLVLTGIAIL